MASAVRTKVHTDAVGAALREPSAIVRAAAEELRDSERRFRELIDALPAAIYTTDAEGRLTHVNPAAVEFSGRVPELGTDHWCVSWKLYHADGTPMPHDECPMAIALKEGRVVRGVEAIAERPDGTRIWFEPYPTPLHDAEGRIVGGVNMLVDITERKQAEQFIRAGEREFSDFFESASVALHWVGPDGIILRVNQAELDMLGHTKDEYLGRHIAEFHVDQPVIENILARLTRGEILRDHPARLRCKDGSIRDVLINSSVLFENGEFIHTRCFTTDVTDQKKAEAAGAYLAAIVQSSDDAIITKNLDGIITTWNQSAERLFGYTAQEAVGQPITMLIPPDRRHEEPRIIHRLKRGERVDHFETQRVRKDGSLVDVSLTISPVKDASGRVVGASKIARDITERRQAQAQLEADLADTKLLQSLSAEIIHEQNVQTIYDRIMDTAVGIMRAEFASMQMLYRERGSAGELRLLAFRGFNPEAAKFWEWVRADSNCTCGVALKTRRRCIAADIPNCDFMAGTPDQANYAQAGILACQSTPLISRSGTLVGMLSTHWNKPHEPSERDLRLLDILARQAADLIERKRAEEAAHGSQERLRRNAETFSKLVERAPFGIYTVDAEFRIAQVSAGAQPAFRNVRPLIGRDFAEAMRILWPEPFAGEVVAIFRHTLKTGEAYVAPSLTAQRRDLDAVESYEWQVHRVTLPDGQYGVVCYFFDATQLRQAEHALRESEELRRYSQQAAGAGTWTWDQADGAVQWSDECYELFGIDPQTALHYESWRNVVHPDDRERADAAAKQAMERGEELNVEYRINHSKRGERWLTSIGRMIDPVNRPGYMTGISLDITERKAAEKALRESEERFRSLVSVITDVPWVTDASGAFVARQLPWEAYTGQTWDEHRGFGWADALHAEDRAEVLALWARACESRTPYESHGRLAHEPTGQYRYVRAQATPLLNADGSVREWVGSYTDIDDQRRLLDEREEILASERAARTEAERASHLKEEFLATLSHELRTPLNAILGWAQLIKRGKMPADDTAQGIDIIEQNARAQAQLIEDLLDVSCITSGKLRLDVQTLDVAPLVEAAVAAVEPTAEAKQIRIQKVLDAAAGPVKGDPTRLQQVIWNLLTNAIKFTPKGGRIRVGMARVDSQVEITVSDTGQGIKPEFLPYVFERFRQGDATTTKRFGGLGLGLAIVKQLVEMHAGEVRVNSAGEGKGASFTVSLPVLPLADGQALAVASALRSVEDADRPMRLSGVTALVVDDEKDARELIHRVLADADVEVRQADSVTAALRLFAQNPPHILISDIGMAGEDGYDLIRRIRALPAEEGGTVPAIALTAYARSQDRTRAILAGYNTHISKPVQAAELVAVAAGLLGRTSRRQ